MRRIGLAGTLAAATVAGLTIAAPAAIAAPGAAAAGSARPDGATLPFVSYDAEDGATNGTVIGPDRAYGTIAAESIGRKAVRLEGTGKYVEFRLQRAANALNVRASLPDTADGAGRDATLGVVVGGQRIAAVPLSSRYSWYYGQFPWSNTPADGGPRQVYDDGRVLLPRTLPAGTRVRLQVGAADASPSYTVDVADFEQVAAPAKAPRGALDVTTVGADATGKKDSTAAIQKALDTAKGTGRTVWLPRGSFKVTEHLIVDRVTMRGAGPWYSVLTGEGVGVYGRYNPNPSSKVHLGGFAVFGEVKERVDADQLNAIGGALNDSTVDDVWLQHTKVGFWMDGPMRNFDISDSRILDQTADGLNFHQGVVDSKVTNTFVRNTGDDGLAMWSERLTKEAGGNDQGTNRKNVFRNNTVQAPILANAIAIYGGTDNVVTDNLVTDTVTEGGGVQIANRFNAVPLRGMTEVSGNTLLRTGSLGLYSRTGNGAIWFWAADSPITGTVKVDRNRILDSSYEAVQFTGLATTGAVLTRNTIAGAGTFAVQVNAPGTASFKDVHASGLGAAAVYLCPTDTDFTIVDKGGNRGLSSRVCGYPAPGPLKVEKLGETIQLFSDGVGRASAPTTLKVSNPSATAQRIASITATGAYRVSDDCGTSLAPGASCTVSVTFVPSKGGDRSGALTVSDGTGAGRYQVYLRGLVKRDTTGNLTPGHPVYMSDGTSPSCCTAGNVNDGNPDSIWEGPKDTFPSFVTVDLETSQRIGRVVVTLPWPRTQQMSIGLGDNGYDFTPVVPRQDFVFSSEKENVVEFTLPAGSAGRYLRLTGYTNSAWNAVQVGELEAYAPAG